jgi:hypothetical protein
MRVFLLTCIVSCLLRPAFANGTESGTPLNWSDNHAVHADVWRAIAKNEIRVFPSPSPNWYMKIWVAAAGVGLPSNAVFIYSTDSGSCGDDINIYYRNKDRWVQVGAFCGVDMHVLESKTAGVNDLLLIGPGVSHAFSWDGHSWGGTIRAPR